MANFETIYVPNNIETLEEAQEWVMENMRENEDIFQMDIINGILHIWEEEKDDEGNNFEWEVSSFNDDPTQGLGTKKSLILNCS